MTTQFVFERSEKKYLVDISTAELVRSEVGLFLPSEVHNGSEVSLVRSVYFDSAHWRTYMDYLTDQKHRFKVRMRQYGKDGVYPKSCFFELKEKLDFMTFKKRLKLKAKWMGAFLGGAQLMAKLVEYNKGMSPDQVAGVYKEITEHLVAYELLPTVEVTYQRQAYEDERRSIRITFDRYLAFRALPFLGIKPVKPASVFPSDRVVIEVKSVIGRPVWLREILDQFRLTSQRFSKYATAVEELFAPELQPSLMPIAANQREAVHGTIC